MSCIQESRLNDLEDVWETGAGHEGRGCKGMLEVGPNAARRIEETFGVGWTQSYSLEQPEGDVRHVASCTCK